MYFNESTQNIKRLLKIEESTPRDEGDALIWYLPNGTVSRKFGPAIEYKNGDTEWVINGVYHRDNGPAIESSKGNRKEWYRFGKRHREFGPALEIAGTKKWYINGQLHNEDGPAVILFNGKVQYWIEGTRYYPELESRYTDKGLNE